MVIIIVLGMHKSGTTLVARTLHEAGYHMGVTETGSYPRCKYEDQRAQRINNDIIFDGRPRKSLTLPLSRNDRRSQIGTYAMMRAGESRDWGIKVPGITLAYEQWGEALPPHEVIGVRRSLAGVQKHYADHQRGSSPELVEAVWSHYNRILDDIGCPVVRFENLLEFGPGAISEALGIGPLPDVRERGV